MKFINACVILFFICPCLWAQGPNQSGISQDEQTNQVCTFRFDTNNMGANVIKKSCHSVKHEANVFAPSQPKTTNKTYHLKKRV